MARDLSCPSGLKAHKNKADAVKANPGEKVFRCDRCRWWHVKSKHKKGRRRAA